MTFYSDFAGHYDDVFPCRPATTSFLDRRLPDTGRVLDIGCGTGGHLATLTTGARTGLGIDPDPGMIAESARRHPGLAFLPLGMEELDGLPSGDFNGVVCIGNVLAHLADDKLERFVAEVARLLAPGGVWIFQTVNFDPILRRRTHVFPEIELPAAGLVFRREYRDIEPGHLVFATELTGPEGVVFAGTTELYPRTAEAYRAAHASGPWGACGHYADWSETPYRAGVDSGSIFVWRRGA